MTWLDRSAAALKIAQARAAARGLTNIVWEQRSLLELPGSGLGPFDYIDCCGVLHHLPDPAAGLRALLSVLAPGGGLGLMVYAPHGRTGVYMLQDALRLLAPADEAPAARLDVAKRVMRHLPETAWLRRNGFLDDHVNGGDAGLYDLLLNPRDRAFTVRELHALLAGGGAGGDLLGRADALRSDPAAARSAAAGAGRGARSGRPRRAGRGAGRQYQRAHRLLRARGRRGGARPTSWRPTRCRCCASCPGAELAGGIQPDGTITVVFDGLRLPVALPPLAPAILRLVDGRRSVRRDRRGAGGARHRRGGVRARLARDVHRAGADQPAVAGGAGRLRRATSCSSSECPARRRSGRSARRARFW